MTKLTQTQITAVILAGGMGRRMGGQDKGLFKLNGLALIEHVLAAISPQVETVLINANRHQREYTRYGYPVIADQLQGYQGPLAGFAAGLIASDTPYIVTLPCDGPFVTPDMVTRLINALTQHDADIAVAHDGERLQPVYALIPKELLPDLQDFLASGDRKIDRWYARHHVALGDFSDSSQTFLNINTPEDEHKLQREVIIA